MSIPQEISIYGNEIETFIKEDDLPTDWFTNPEYIELTAPNSNAYKRVLNNIKRGALGVGTEDDFETELRGRMLAVVILAGAMAVGSDWKLRVVKLKEQMSSTISDSGVEVGHMAFYVPKLKPVEMQLETIDDIMITNERENGTDFLGVMLNRGPQIREVRFTNRSVYKLFGLEQDSEQDIA